MAVRTGTQLKSDADAALTALNTAITTPTVSNIEAAIAAFQTVETNGFDSQFSTQALSQSRGYGKDLAVMGRAAKRDLQLSLRRVVDAQGTVDANGARKVLNRLKRNLDAGLFSRVKGLPTTD